MKGYLNINRAPVTFIMLVFWLTSAGAQMPQTNEQYVAGSISEVIALYLDSLALEPSKAEIENSNGLDRLAVDGLKFALINDGWTITADKPEISGNGYVINVSLSAFDFKYKNGKSRGFLKRPYIKREASGQIFLSISGQDINRVAFLDFFDADEVLPANENYIASLRYKELTPPSPNSGLSQFLEPLAVTATVGGLIYLFFVNR